MLTVDLDRLGIEPGHRLLDAGCGGGRHCFGAMDRGAHAIGVDLDTAGLRVALGGIAERKARSSGAVHGGVLRGDVFRLPYRDASFDRVICAEVMEHVHDHPAALRELVRVLRPDGRIAITIPTAISEQLYLRLSDEYFESPGGHIRVFRPAELARALARVGVRVHDVSFAHSLHTPYWAIRCALGLHDESPTLTRGYRRFLMHASTSRGWSMVERCLDSIWPKSLILYGTRVASGAG